MSVESEFLNAFTQELIIQSAPQSIVDKLNQIKKRYKQSEIEERIKKPREKEINEGITKIAIFLENPNINMIECNGPGKYLIIEKQNKKTPIHLILSNQEIKDIIRYFSEKTNTPITNPTYKTALNNMILTSINSKFGGKKFIITKTTSQHSRFL